MRESARAAAAALAALTGLGGCGNRETARDSAPAVAVAGEVADACAGDSLRPATAAPAPGLWLFERPSGERVAAMIGPLRQVDNDLVVVRTVETTEVSGAGDTIPHRVAAAAVTLKLLPPLGTVVWRDSIAPDSTAGPQPAATYVLSPHVWLAAYEPCATSRRGPRIRYLRRDAAGRVVTDVLLHRTSE